VLDGSKVGSDVGTNVGLCDVLGSRVGLNVVGSQLGTVVGK